LLTCATFRKSFIIYLLPPAQGKEEGGGLEVAGPGLGGRQVAVLRLHAASASRITTASIRLCEGNVCALEHIGNAPNFGESP
jgi:hypothetical protein